jgi:CheY-like chemotaxis protein
MAAADQSRDFSAERPILVVDDSTCIREALRELLEDEGYAVDEAEHGQAALERLARLPKPRLVILDLIMPVMSGAEFLAILGSEARAEEIPVVVFSAVAGMGWMPVAPHRRLRKPIDFDQLLMTITELCH